MDENAFKMSDEIDRKLTYIQHGLLFLWLTSFAISCVTLLFYDKNLALALLAILNGFSAFGATIFVLGIIDRQIQIRGSSEIEFQKSWTYRYTPLLCYPLLQFIYMQEQMVNPVIPLRVRSLFLRSYSVLMATIILILITV